MTQNSDLKEKSLAIGKTMTKRGFDLKKVFAEKLTFVPPKYRKKPHQAIEDFYADRLDWEALKERMWKTRNKDDILALISGEEFLERYNFEEIVRFYFAYPHQTLIDKELFNRRDYLGSREEKRYGYVNLDNLEKYEIIKKLRSAIQDDKDWNVLVEAYDSIASFNFGVKDFSTRIDWTTWHHAKGLSTTTHLDGDEAIYLDGILGFFIFYKNKHVMTIGFNITPQRQVLISQVQLKKKKGNRFIYKIPYKMDRLDWVLCRFYYAFPDWQICLVDGENLADSYIHEYSQRRREFFQLKARYPEQYKDREPPEEFPEETYERIVNFYNKELQCFERIGTTKYEGKKYFCLEPILEE